MDSPDDIFVPNTDFCIAGPNANQKQIQFLRTVFSFEHITYIYGGAIRGGKTYAGLYTIHSLSQTYPGSRWAVVRDALPVIKSTTIPSFNKLIETDKYGKWNLSEHTFTYFNGSQIKFMAESFSQDPYLTDFLGFECNGMLLEQMEGITKNMYDMAMQRVGTWKLKKQPPEVAMGKMKPLTKGIIIGTFNPSQTWVKGEFYLPYTNGTLPPHIFYLPALPEDNKKLPPDLYAQWSLLPERYQLQFIKGDWTDFADKNNLWAFSFDRSIHVCPPEDFPELERGQMLYLSFDFNRNPICCSVIQHMYDTIYVHETIKLNNSDIYALCNYIKSKYPAFMYMVTGDASGKNSMALVQDGLNYYTVIRSQLSLGDRQLSIPLANPALSENQVLVNALLSNYNIQIHEKDAASLIYDLANVRMNADGTIIKGNREDPTQQADALDTFRYWCNMFMGHFLQGL